ncbi:MAG: AAA family ATPase, partial [Proteobacteria bacterium]|nr:AAA family ATPase [Pseudomonadota bacterium]
MRLMSFQVREFQSVWDSGEIEIGDVTCLVGKNEAGKTALLQALYKINPIIANHANFDVTDDYPRKEIGDYQHQVDAGTRTPAIVIETTFQIEDTDAEAVTAVFGENALSSRSLKLLKGYSNKCTFYLDFDENAARVHLIDAASLVDPLREQLRGVDGWEAFLQVLESAEATEAVTGLKKLVAKFKDHGAQWHAYNSILIGRIPKFLYFVEYYQMVGHENVD